MNKKRDIASEIMEGIEAMREHRERKITLRTYTIEKMPIPEIDAQTIRETREHLNLSRSIFAHRLRVSPRTLEKWEQGISKPNDQAAALILLVRKFPDTLDRLRDI